MNLQRDAGFMMSNLQILAQFVMSLHRMSSEMLSIGVDHVVFPVEEVDRLSVMPRAQRAAKYMTAMGLWRPPSGPGAPGPLPTSSCPSCMNCEYCFGRKETSTQGLIITLLSKKTLLTSGQYVQIVQHQYRMCMYKWPPAVFLYHFKCY